MGKTSESLPARSKEHEGTPENQPSPRAFATGTGYVFQGIGLLLAFGACLFWLSSGRVVESSADTAGSWFQHLAGERSAAAVLTIVAATSLVGGLGLMAVGTGLQAERPTSGRDAMIVTGCMGGIYLGAAALLLFKANSWAGAVPMGFLFALCVVLFMLAGHSASVFRAFPPPADPNVLTEEFRRKFNEERRERMSKYDL